MSKRIREQFENETGEKADVYDYVVNPKYLKWLEQRLEAGQHETIVITQQTKEKACGELIEWMDKLGLSFNESGSFENECETIWNIINPE